MTPEEARDVGARLAEATCNAQGIPVDLDTPDLIAQIAAWVRAGTDQDGGGDG
jgi:hypothetical protein